MINRFVLYDWSVIRSDFKCPINVFWQQLLAWQKKRRKRNHRLKGIDFTATGAETESIDVTATGHVVFGTGIRRLDVSSRAGARRLRYVSLPSRRCIVTIWNDLKYYSTCYHSTNNRYSTCRNWWEKLWGRTIRFQSLSNPSRNPPSSWSLPTWRNAQFITGSQHSRNQMIK